MAKTDTTTKLPDTNALAELELANASLAERVGELETELAQRDETIARLLPAAEQRERDVELMHLRMREVESMLPAVEAQRDQAAVLLRERDADLAGAAREIEGLHEELRRRSSSAPIALNITALLELHRIVGSDSDRYLATARRLGDALVAQLDASDSG